MIIALLKRWYRELFLVTILLICIFNAIRTSSLATRKANPPEAFFPPNSLIIDFKYGEIRELSQLVFQNEVTFVMYYAPWNYDSIVFRSEYLKIAKHYKDQILFAAVNCWWPDGECNKSYRIKKYPVLMARIFFFPGNSIHNLAEVEYKGPLVASYLIPFLDNLLNPVKPIQNEADLLDLKSKHDGVVVSYFDFIGSADSPNYKNFLLASIRALFQDPFRRIQFAIVSSEKAANKLNIEQLESVSLHTWNNTYMHKGSLKKTDHFLKWLFTSLDKEGVLVEWISPIALKSDTLSVKLLSAPTLILFTPRSLILNISPYYDILREVAMDYYNCDNAPEIKSLIHRTILRRRLKEEKLFELEDKCHQIASRVNTEESRRLNLPQDIVKDEVCCHSQLVDWRSFDKRCQCTVCVQKNLKLCPSGCKKFNCLATASRYLVNFEAEFFENSINNCNDIKSTYHPKYTPFYSIEMTCTGDRNNEEDLENDNIHETKNSRKIIEKIDQSTDFNGESHVDENMQRMLQNFEEQHCKRLSLGLNYNDFNFPESSDSGSQKWRQNFSGLGCQSNKTLGFIAIDSLMYPSFTESLGINAFHEMHATVIMIVEAQKENIYVLNHQVSRKESEITKISKKMIYEFVKDYESGKLKRYLQSPFSKSISTSNTCSRKIDDVGRPIVCVPEITTHSFEKIVLDNSKDVVLLFYTNWCGWCSSAASTFLQVANFFTSIDGIVFARINADINDLPFEYSVDRYPTIILFPAGRKSESVTYPIDKHITATNLMQWVFAHVQDIIKWRSSFRSCDKLCLNRNLIANHFDSNELKSRKMRLSSRIEMLKRHIKSSFSGFNSPTNGMSNKALNEILQNYNRFMRGKSSKLDLFDHLKEILSKRISNLDHEQSEDSNGRYSIDMMNKFNAPKKKQHKIQEFQRDASLTKAKKSKLKTISKFSSKYAQKDEL